GYIDPLASLPDAWSEGEFEGLCARNGFVVSAAWKNKKIVSLKVLSKRGERLIIKCDPSKISCEGENAEYTEKDGLVILDTQKDKEYIFGF
ncbi:MAG: hypothetical protein K2J79_09855, partial [Ruminiclostridium sp.]|nr:hypothetical protein [Ruminiclostridium sp.]